MTLKGIDDYMLPCLSKKYLGFECLGCGAQRATAFLFQGEFVAAFKMFPAIYPLSLLLLFIFFDMFVKTKHAQKIKITLLLLTATALIANFLIKLWVR
jgi:hypothetical protein